MLKFGLKPAMGLGSKPGDHPLEELNTIIDFSKRAQDSGFDSIWLGQHYFGGQKVRWEVIPTLARLIPEIKGSIVGTCILLLPLHHPVLVAEQIAILDILSNGKFIFGVGLGYRQREFDGFGVPKRQRVSRFEEALSIIKALWTTHRLRYHGRYYQIGEVTTSTLPLQKPTPPIWIAAHGDPAVRRAARLGDSLMMNPHAAIDTLERQLAIYGDALRQESKPFPEELSIRKDIYVAAQSGVAWQEAENEIPKLVEGFTEEKQYQEIPDSDRPAAAQTLKAFIGSRYIVGNPGDCIEQIKSHRARLRTNHFIFRIACPDGNRQKMMEKINLIGREIIEPMKRVG